MNRNPDYQPFHLRLKSARQEAHLKQEAVGRYLGIPTSAVSAFESAQRKLDAQELFKLSKLYNKPMDWFFNERPDYVFISAHGAPSGEKRDPLLDSDPLVAECVELLRKAPRHLQKSAAHGIIGFLSP